MFLVTMLLLTVPSLAVKLTVRTSVLGLSLVFALIVSLVGCYYGMRTTGGTQGVGRSTTSAVVSWVAFGSR